MSKNPNKNELEVMRLNEIDEIYSNKHVAISNALVQAREKTSLLESKIELLAIYKISQEYNTRQKKDAQGNYYDVHYVRMTKAEIAKLTNRLGGSIYTQIENAAYELKGKLYIYRDPNSEQFKMKSLYGDVTYGNGILDIEFNPDTEYLFLDLKDNYSKIKLDIAFKFKTNGGFQMYKLLKAYTYELPKIDLSLSQEDLPIKQIMYSLSDFRLQLGYVDLNQPDIKREGQSKNPNFDKMVQLEKKPKFKVWADFRKRVVDPGIKEINEISDIYIIEVKEMKGAHNKIEGVSIRFQQNRNFYLKDKKDKPDKNDKPDIIDDEIIELSPEQMDDFIDKLREIIDEPIKIKDFREIAKCCNYNIEKVEKAYQVCKQQKEYRESFMATIIWAIKNNIEPNKEKKTNKKNTFYNIPKSDIDFDELEKALLRNDRRED